MVSTAPCSAGPASDLPRISVLGSLNMDLVSYVSHHPAPGETMLSDGFAVSPGGKGANQAVACAKLSRARPTTTMATTTTTTTTTATPPLVNDATATAVVAMVGVVGNDANGATLRANLGRHGVDVAGVRVLSSATTGVAVIVVDAPTGQNRIILSPGANYACTWDDVAVAAGLADGESDSTTPSLLVLQLEIPLPLVVRALAAARARGIPVLLNPAPAPSTEATRATLEAAFRSDGKRSGLAHLVLNEVETAALVPGLTVADIDDAAGLARAAQYFVDECGVQNVVLTLGGRGVYYATSGGAGTLVPAEHVAHVVDTTGAGDTFAGQYALEVVYAAAAGQAFDCGAAVRKAQRASAQTVQRRGAQDSIPWRDELP